MIILIILIVAFIQLSSATRIHSPIEYIGKSPYHVSIHDLNGTGICSGAIIKSNLILASGNCYLAADHIIAGSEFPTENQTTTQNLKITKIERNIGIHGERYMNLYYLEKDLKFGYGVQPIKLSIEIPAEKSLARITGFGEFEGEKRLRSKEVKIGNYDECKALLPHPKYNSKVTCSAGNGKAEMCYALEITSLLTCYGNQMELCGLFFIHLNFVCVSNKFSYGTTENEKSFMVGFVRFSDFKDWLKSHNAL